jgi:hypothetical protein
MTAATEAPAFSVGQKVKIRSNRWTPNGWEPIEQIGTVINPRVENDPPYNGDVEVKIEGELSRCFYSPNSIEAVATEAPVSTF